MTGNMFVGSCASVSLATSNMSCKFVVSHQLLGDLGNLVS